MPHRYPGVPEAFGRAAFTRPESKLSSAPVNSRETTPKSAMDICHPHNLLCDLTAPRRYGVRVTLPPEDTFSQLLGNDWERVHWFATREERDRALRDMASEHLYSRRGDRPTLRFEPIDDPADEAR